MDPIGITSIKVGNKNNLKVKANENIPLIFTFNRPLGEGETVTVNCFLHERQFNLNKDHGRYALFSKPSIVSKWLVGSPTPNHESEPVNIILPEELAGATVNLTFSIKRNPKDILENLNPLLSSKTITLEVLSGEGEPKIESIYWSDTKEIEYGKPSAERTDALRKNETAYLHIHTKGLYGKQIQCVNKSIPEARTIQIRNNIAVVEYRFFSDKVNHIEIECSSSMLGKLASITGFSSSNAVSVTIPYMKDEEVVLSTKTSPVLTTPSSAKKVNYASEANCRVDFRPKKDYDGSYGFSWYRINDMSSGTGHSQSSVTASRTNQPFLLNRPFNDQPFSDTDFPGKGIMGRHYETVSNWFFWTKDQIVNNGNNSGTGSGVNYPKAGVRDNFIPDPVMAADHKKDYPKISIMGYTDSEPLQKEYLTPVMTIAEGKTVELQFLLHVKESPEEILFVFDNPRVETDGVMTVNVKPSDIKSPPTTTAGSPSIAYTIEIVCNKKFDKEIRLKAYAVPKGTAKGMVKKENGRLVVYPQEGTPLVLPELCGMLRFLPNDDAHWRYIDVVFFNVKTRLKTVDPPKNGLIIPTIELELPPSSMALPIPMRQPEPTPPNLPTLQFPTAGDSPFSLPKLPLPPPPKPVVIVLPPVQVEYLNTFLAQAYVKANVKVETIDLDGNSDYEKVCVDINGDGILDGINYNKSGSLTSLLKNHPLYDEYDAKNYICFFFIADKAYSLDDTGKVVSGINGYSYGENFTICFDGARKETPVHELGHTLGLPHTFDGNTSNGAKYTYEDGKTDNIMDYSHSFGVNIPRQSFFHWQWETLNKKLSK